jgi:uncharacterized NAD-dependent epimerase/dehydratase family protein
MPRRFLIRAEGQLQHEDAKTATGAIRYLEGEVLGIALPTASLGEANARVAIEQAEEDTGLPVTDAVRFGAGRLVGPIWELLSER